MVMIKLEDLVVGKKYKGEGRNFDEGIWNGEGFVGMRYKFGGYLEDIEYHWDSDPVCGTFKPEKQLD